MPTKSSLSYDDIIGALDHFDDAVQGMKDTIRVGFTMSGPQKLTPGTQCDLCGAHAKYEFTVMPSLKTLYLCQACWDKED